MIVASLYILEGASKERRKYKDMKNIFEPIFAQNFIKIGTVILKKFRYEVPRL